MTTDKWIYLDNNATTATDPLVFEKMTPYYTELFGNPSSMHAFGNIVDREINTARENTAALLNAGPSQIIFTSGATESIGTVFHALTELYPEKKHIITTAVEHPAVLNTCHYLEKQRGYDITYLSVDKNGQLDPDHLRDAIQTDTLLVSIMWANNETGILFPIEKLAAIAREKGVLFHTDAVQAVGKINIDLSKVPVDYLSLSAHKFHGPKGVGALYIRPDAPFHPLLVGGHQENGRRAGTLNAPGIIGLGEACRLAHIHLKKNTYQKIAGLRDNFEKQLEQKIAHINIHGKNSPRLPTTSNIGFRYIEGESITILLSQNQIAVSTGSACTSETLEPSHVLKEMGVIPEELHGSIRFSFSRQTTARELEKTIEIQTSVIKRLRELSPLKPDNE